MEKTVKQASDFMSYDQLTHVVQPAHSCRTTSTLMSYNYSTLMSYNYSTLMSYNYSTSCRTTIAPHVVQHDYLIKTALPNGRAEDLAYSL